MASSKKSGASWSDLPVHPACALFDPLTADELRELGEDIKKHGLVSPITIFRDHGGKYWLLDGYNRLAAMKLVGIRFELSNDDSNWRLRLSDDLDVPPPKIVSAEDCDPVAYVISVNIHRRHLTAEDKHKAVVGLLKAQPEKSNRQIAKMAEASHPYIAKVRKKLEEAGDVETVTTSIDTKGRKQPSRRPWSRERWVRTQVKRVERNRKLAELHGSKPGAATENSAAARDDIGPTSVGELARLNVCIDELQIENRRLTDENLALKAELAKVKDELAKANAELDEIIAAQADDDPPPPAADNTLLPLPPFRWRPLT
jgi:hypothetical protein